MDIDDLRSQWNSIDVPEGFDPGLETERRVAASRVPTLRDSLHRLFLRMVAICCVGIATVIPFAHDHMTLFIVSLIFFIVMICVNLVQACAVSRIDMGRETVHSTLRRVYAIERRRLLTRIFGLMTAIPLVIYMTFTLAAVYGRFMMAGCMIGCVLGATIGLLINRRATSLLRDLRSSLEE